MKRLLILAPMLISAVLAGDVSIPVYNGITINAGGGGGDTMWYHVDTLTMTTHTHWDCDSGDVKQLTLTADDTMLNPTNVVNGRTYQLMLEQDGTGGWDVFWGANFRWTADAIPTITATASAGDLFEFLGWRDSLMVFKSFSPAVLP